MARQYGRAEIMGRLNACVTARKPIIVGGAGFGLAAKCEDIGGIDLIVVYCSGKSRRLGVKTSLVGDYNAVTKEIGEEVLFVVRTAPVIAGIQAIDPTRDMDRFVDELLAMGFSGIMNYPSVGLYGREWINDYEEDIQTEMQVFERLKRRGIFTMSYVYRLEEATRLAPLMDVVVAHAGWTAGGLVGASRALSLPDACKMVQELIDAARRANPDVICLAHGGPLVTPEDTAYLYRHTTAVGYVGASSIERIPIERAVVDTVRAFKSVPLP